MTKFVFYNLNFYAFYKVDIRKLLLLPILCLLSCGDTQYIIGGERININDVLVEASDNSEKQNNLSGKLTVSVPKLNTFWSHRNGNVRHSTHHPDIDKNFKLLWRTKIGAGNTKKTRITADPIIANGMIFVMDSMSKVSGVNSNGKVIWSISLVPKQESSKDASGGGLSFDNGSIYVVTGFGEVFRINSIDGKVVWKRKLDAPISAPPTVDRNLLYIITKDNGVWALNKKMGDIEWFRDGSPSKSAIIGGSAVALEDEVIIIPSGSGEVVAALKDSGMTVWSTFVTGYRSGKGYANFSDITSDPVIKGKNVYVGNQSGALASIDLNSGKTLSLIHI